MDWKEGGEEELHHYMIFVTLKENSSLSMKQLYPINLIKLTKICIQILQVFKTKRMILFTIDIIFQLYISYSWGRFIKSARRALCMLS